jgi:L-ascorbate metabolism protein UlaG (beta-lactamase superfamily)
MSTLQRTKDQNQLEITFIGGPTALLEWGNFRLLTDPTFDPPGGEYATGPVVLKKLVGPAMDAESLGRIDAVLLSHDHHYDNLDRSGRSFLTRVSKVVTTTAGAQRLGGNAIGLEQWQSIDLTGKSGSILRITGTPARHGPAGLDRGPVMGFVLSVADSSTPVVYVSGDTVWYEGVAEVARRFNVQVAVLFMGAARVPVVGPDALTMTAADGIEAARAFYGATIVPLHYEGWAHISESRSVIASAFEAAGLGARLRWPEPSVSIPVAA